MENATGDATEGEATSDATGDATEGGDAFVDQQEGGENFNAAEFVPGESQPTAEMDASQGGVFTAQATATNPGEGSSGVNLKTWQKKKKTITTRAEIMRARSTRERKLNKKYYE